MNVSNWPMTSIDFELDDFQNFLQTKILIEQYL